ncbi:MAG: TlpA family protein disulfide reductase [Gemmatimonadales bacterium]|nr:TlpA family protein disulfide reductase [Gemmatimonadales bacterium]
MNKQWLAVLAIVAGLGLGATALVKFAPVPEGAQVGNRAPDFQAVNLLTNDSISFREAYTGHVTLVNIWATWCAPCRAEMPAMEELYQAFKDQGFRIAAVSVDEGGPADVMAFARELGLSFDILHDRDGRIQQQYMTTGVPESFLIDGEGVIVRKQIGEHPWSSPANRRILEQLLGQRGGTTAPAAAPPAASDLERTPSGG